jgi:hypothetical protein
VEQLRAILTSLRTVNTLEDVRQFYQPTDADDEQEPPNHSDEPNEQS